MDSDNLRLRYILTKDPPSGQVQLSRDGGLEKVSVKGPVQSFTQADVNKGGGGLKMGGKGGRKQNFKVFLYQTVS